MKTVFKTEIKSLLSGKRAYIYTALMLIFSGYFIARYNLVGALPNLEYSLEIITFPTLFLLPLICSDIFSGKQTRGFDNMLFSLGVHETDLLFGRILARLAVFAPAFVILMIMPPILSIFGNANMPEAYVGLLGYLLFCLAVMSVYIFVSALTKSSAVSAAICYAAAIAMYCFELLYTYLPRSVNISFFTLSACVMALIFLLFRVTGSETFSTVFAVVLEIIMLIVRFAFPKKFEKALPMILKALSPRSALTGFFYGLLDLGEVLYLLCFIAVFTFMTLVTLEKRRYDGKEV